jgi:hypothetical protein
MTQLLEENAMPPPWVGVAQGRIIGEIHGQQTVNVLHFATNNAELDNPSNMDAVLLALAQAIRDCVVEFLLPAVTSDWKLVQCDAKRILPVASDPIVDTGVPTDVGQLGPTSVSFASSLMKLRTGGGGRSGRGRNYLPPAGEANITNSSIDAPTLVLLAAFTACVATKFMGANPESGWTLVVLSQKNLAAVGGNMNNATRVVTNINLEADVKRMSSRQKGYGS